MKTLLLLLGIVMMLTEPLRAEIGLGDVLGTAWTIGDKMIGETTITPAYAVTDYTLHVEIYTITNGLPKFFYQYGTFKYHRNLLGNVFFHTSAQIIRGVSIPASDQPFPIDSVDKMNMTCGGYTTNSNEVRYVGSLQVETHKETVWLAQVVSTGLWPDDRPWKVWLKTAGQKCNCSGPHGNCYYWTPATVGKSGSEVVSLGTPNCILAYPFYLASEFYK